MFARLLGAGPWAAVGEHSSCAGCLSKNRLLPPPTVGPSLQIAHSQESWIQKAQAALHKSKAQQAVPDHTAKDWNDVSNVGLSQVGRQSSDAFWASWIQQIDLGRTAPAPWLCKKSKRAGMAPTSSSSSKCSAPPIVIPVEAESDSEDAAFQKQLAEAKQQSLETAPEDAETVPHAD
jgi:hypothetical protein